ncbi:1,5-anhydro-D-fructose reductase-like [Amphibalanus amphitrite]|uniref:1,5-anhydro-D-fructose reductase-like n=1 Tax=Amphibalanus amphitrite TaxID=1232801 RepID=UPI001C92625B|nr:1,5-anhydro-D-fructose reductase-like [Amphibalanus amphitrite]
MTPSVQLSNGMQMPLLGLGCWQADDGKDVAVAVEAALLAGYRHIDTAYFYANEADVGRGIKAAIATGKVKRSDIFVTTKLPPIGMRPERVEKYLRKSLKALDLDYIDLYLVHHPVGFEEVDENDNMPLENPGTDKEKVKFDFSTDLIAIWKKMENMVELGLAKTIGISNFNPRQMRKITAIAKIPPTVNQVECHVYFQQKELREACKQHNIAVTAYGPLGSPGRKLFYEKQGKTIELPDLLRNPVVRLVSDKHERSAAQVLLRFITQEGIIVIPKSTNESRIKQNGDIFSFELDEVDRQALRSLDQGVAGTIFKFAEIFPGYEEHPECFF